MRIENIFESIDTSAGSSWIEGARMFLREELETAWLRGWVAGECLNDHIYGDKTMAEGEAVDYAERVVGGSTRPERPEASRRLSDER